MTNLTNKLKSISISLFLLITSFLYGCASIPSEAPELSAELGERISALEEANINLLHRFFDLKRIEVDNFIQNEWVSEFIGNLFVDPQIKDAWNVIVSENIAADRLNFYQRTGLKIQEKINSKRLELIKPLDDVERLLEQNIRYEYNYARSLNNSITSFLLSASKVDENSKRYFNLIGLNDKNINNVIDATDQIVNKLVITGGEVEDKIIKGEEYVKELNSLKELLTENKENENAN